jgi:hypothetical protein
LTKREDGGNWKSKQWMSVCGQQALEEATDPT